MDIYRGDTFEFDFNAILDDGATYTFQEGDLLKIGVKQKVSNTNYILYREIEILEDTNVVTIIFDHEETKKLCKGDKILEVELTNPLGRVTTLCQEKITVLEDVINE